MDHQLEQPYSLYFIAPDWYKNKNNVVITGEIDLNGNVLAVGGIDLKIEGGKSAGVDTINAQK